tara:strand:- start:20253 stop:20969 length:717 start_codon:yes stop_codon:yes gene_type:complete
MSKVSFTPIQPGEEASITNPNALMTATNTATASINQENVRVEGIDERNIVFPLMTFKSYTSEDHVVKLGTGTLDAWTKIPAGTNFTGGSQPTPTFLQGVPITVNLGSSYKYAVIRYSFEVRIEGRVHNSSHSKVNEDVGFCVFVNNIPLLTTERHIQNAIAGSKGRAGSENDSARSVESITIFHPVTVSGNFSFDLRYYIDTHSNGALAPDTNSGAVVTSNDEAVRVSRITASVIKYK